MANKYVSLSTDERNTLISALKAMHIPDRRLISKIEKASQRIGVRSAKAKGMSLQNSVCLWISELIGVPFLRGDDESLIAPRPSGQNGVDIILRGEARKRFPYSVECKKQEQLNLVDTVEQASANKMADTDWLIVHERKALSETIVMMSWSAFEKLFMKKR